MQLYGTDPVYVGKAAEILCDEYGVGPHRPQLRLPGPEGHAQGRRRGAAVEARLLGRILEQAVAAATPYDVPVTMKTRKGLDDDHLTYLDAGRIAQESGCAAIALHGRTVAQAYSGGADWDAIAGLVAPSTCRCSATATSGRRRTPADGRADRCCGVVVGRGCLGRPWLFRDLAAAFDGERRSRPCPPSARLPR